MRVLLVAVVAWVAATCGGQDAASDPGQPASPLPSEQSTTASAPTPTMSALCPPSCVLMQFQTPGLSRPGPLAAGTYTTTVFYPGGMTVTIDDGWSSHEDNTGEFSLDSASNPDDQVLFWLDMTPVTFDGKSVPGVASTPQGNSDRLHGLAELKVSPQTRTTIGEGPSPGTRHGLGDRLRRAQWRPGMPDPSVRQRVHLSPVRGAVGHVRQHEKATVAGQVGDGPHMLFIVLNVYDAAKFAPVAQPVIDSIRLPSTLDGPLGSARVLVRMAST